MKLKLLALIVGLQAAWMVGTICLKERDLAQGVAILLETRPVDPRDLLRGDYVILNYKISAVANNLFSPPGSNDPAPGTTVYVLLEKRGEFHEVVTASFQPLYPGPGQVMLKGKSNPRFGGDSVRVEYGLERYFVAEGTGNPSGKLTVQVAVPRSGSGTIKQVFIDGQPYAEVMRGR